MSNDFRNFIEEKMNEGFAIEDILDEMANSANAIQEEEDAKRKDTEVKSYITDACELIEKAIKSITDDEDIQDMLAEIWNYETVYSLIKTGIATAKDPSTLIDALLDPLGVVESMFKCEKKAKEQKADKDVDYDEVIKKHIQKLFGEN